MFLKAVNLRKSNVQGIELFLNTILIAKPNLCKSIISELSDFILLSGCKSIEFRKMSNRAMGISKTDVCILNSSVLRIPDEYMIYIILHEVSHQYQYKKYGKDLVLDIYLDIFDLETSAKKLLGIEQIADRLAIAKLNKILKSNNIQLENPIIPRYVGLADLTQIKGYITKIRLESSALNLSTIEEINDYIELSINQETLA